MSSPLSLEGEGDTGGEGGYRKIKYNEKGLVPAIIQGFDLKEALNAIG